ncbi:MULTISPECIES: hypothetical protein [Streptosporangium]|uniref:Uncharacterized protein n=1 Tax=Streptosporangium brasiliense TaxID=47480 RepID=A0ABT9RK51_9ACTN|nr:hypothetical protein [Streptosporangium brasiliense]MDP9869681.1 hypothetical protein [Streptosporangium brasiliense]
MRAPKPVLDEYGGAAIRSVWKLAEERGQTSGTALTQAAIDLDCLPALEAAAGSGSKQAELVWPRHEPVMRVLDDFRGLRQVAAEAPERARLLAAELRQATAELEADLSLENDLS